MLKWFRARAATWALIVLWSFTALGTLSTTAHGLVCGDELAPIFISGHGQNPHTVAAPQTRTRPSHCVICHWMQSFRAAGVRASRVVSLQRPTITPSVSPDQRTRAAVRLNLPSRAPPAYPASPITSSI
jgi:hypothetical protein